MKRGIEAYWGDPIYGCLHLVITKEKGPLTRDEIEDAARDFDPGKYLLIVDASEGSVFQRISAGRDGDTAHLLEMNHVAGALAFYHRTGKEEKD